MWSLRHWFSQHWHHYHWGSFSGSEPEPEPTVLDIPIAIEVSTVCTIEAVCSLEMSKIISITTPVDIQCTAALIMRA